MSRATSKIETIQADLRNGKTTSSQLVRECIERAERLNPRLNHFLLIARDRAIERAEAIDREIASDAPMKPLSGVPVAIKDNILVEGLRATCGSKILASHVATYNATAIEKLEAAGAVIVGKTNCDEFAMGSSNENSAFGPVRNPWNAEYVPGGSSGGSAVAVATDCAAVSLGSDTGGSIRQPASLTGIVGLKPTYGRVSRYGLVAFGSSLDQIGPFGQSVRDVARVLSVIAGRDPHDSTSSTEPASDYESHLDDEIRGLRVGVPREFFAEGIDPEVKAAVESAIAALEKAGATLVDVSLKHTPYAVAVYYIVATAEASANLARYDGVRYGFRAEESEDLSEMYRKTRDLGFGAEVKRRIMLGTFALSSGYYDAYYAKAMKVRTLIERDFREAFTQCDVIATPTSPTPAFKIGEKVDDPLSMYLADIYTITLNLAGVPGLSVPCGFSSKGLPIGLQLIGKHFDEARLLNVAHVYQSAHPTPTIAIRD